ncbi:MAG: exonuclease [Candidatus Woesebacteria bacterium]|nr:exonuclease [Candidatus Woesebacteria bacterium]
MLELNNLIFVDCEGHGPAPTFNDDLSFEFGAVDFKSKQSFHGHGGTKQTFEKFNKWLNQFKGRIIFVSDNPAYDWQFINYYFYKFLGHNPFGHSARRISDFYAGLKGDFFDSQSWKNWRVTPHDHNPVHDALGNIEAFEKILKLVKNDN